MDDNKGRYTRGDINEMTRRLNNVNSISVNCPIADKGMNIFWNLITEHSEDYVCTDSNIANDTVIKNVFKYEFIPINDVFRSFMLAIGQCKKEQIDVTCLSTFWALCSSYKNLKTVELNFEIGQELVDKYKSVGSVVDNKEDLVNLMDSIYKIKILEINLHDLFHQDVIDILNKSFMLNGIIKNSYLDREFELCFSFDNYTTYMDMMVNNNEDTFNYMDGNIIEYLTSFPNIIISHKPIVKIITDYSLL